MPVKSNSYRNHYQAGKPVGYNGRNPIRKPRVDVATSGNAANPTPDGTSYDNNADIKGQDYGHAPSSSSGYINHYRAAVCGSHSINRESLEAKADVDSDSRVNAASATTPIIEAKCLRNIPR